MANPTNHTEIHKILKKHGKVAVRTQNGILCLIREDGRYFYEVNKCVVGISAKSLNEIIDRIPANMGVLGQE